MKPLASRYRRLDDALAALPLDEPMLLTELDGFLTGILVCPDSVTPAEWLPVVWGNDEVSGAPFDDPADVQWFANAVLARYNEIARDLARGKFKPMFDVDERNGDVLWEFWLDGFEQAMELRPEAWAALAEGDDQDATYALSRLSLLIEVVHDVIDIDSVELNAVYDGAPAGIVAIASGLNAARLRSGVIQAPIGVQSAKVGRNDPCRCGSGKKFKRRCG